MVVKEATEISQSMIVMDCKEKAEGLAALLQGKDLLPQALYDVVFDFVYGEDA